MTPAEARRGAMARSAAVIAGMVIGGGALAVSPFIADLAAPSLPSADVAIVIEPEPVLAEPISAAKLTGLMAPWIDLPQSFLPTASGDASAICGALADAGFANSGWSPSGVAKGRWECYAAPAEASAAPYSVFYMLRGTADRIGEMRLKVSLRDAGAVTALRREMTSFLEAFATSARVSFPPAFLATVQSGGWATYVSPRATYTFAREDGDVPKWNLSVAFADPDDIQRADAALTLPVKAVRGRRANHSGDDAGLVTGSVK